MKICEKASQSQSNQLHGNPPGNLKPSSLGQYCVCQDLPLAVSVLIAPKAVTSLAQALAGPLSHGLRKRGQVVKLFAFEFYRKMLVLSPVCGRLLESALLLSESL